MYLEIIYSIYMYKKDLALNNLQYHKTNPKQKTTPWELLYINL